MSVDASYIYWVNGGNEGNGFVSTIGRANLDGTGLDQSFIAGLEGGWGVSASRFPWSLPESDR